MKVIMNVSKKLIEFIKNDNDDEEEKNCGLSEEENI